MKKLTVNKAGGGFELNDERIPDPGSGHARVKVQACGVCHSDSLTKEGAFPGIAYPRSPGHEIAGVIDALGPGTDPWKVGDRVGVGWFGGHCGKCESCRRGDFITCVKLQIPGLSYDGGYSEYVSVPMEALARIPDGLAPEEAAPLMCAGVTTFNALRNSGARPGDLVAIQGIGGLGHLGVQYAARMGFRTAAIARGKDKGPLARQLGAAHYIDSQAADPAAELAKLGGAKVVLATVTHGPAMSASVGGLAPRGRLMVLGAAESLETSPFLLIGGRRSVEGWYAGTSIDSEDTLAFSVQTGVRSMNEMYPLERAAEAYDRMMSGKARFRVVLTM